MSDKYINNGWIPIESYNLKDRTPVLVCDPDWFQDGHVDSSVAMGYYDEYQGGWNISLFEASSSYAFVTYYSKDFKPKYWKPWPLGRECVD